MRRVSVLMTVFNCSAFVGEAIQSILDQTYNNLELIVVDDGSTDGTAEIIREYQRIDNRIVGIYSNHIGRVGCLNVGLSRASGDYVAINDADDVSKPQRIQRQVLFLNEHPEVSVIGTWVDIIDENGRIIGKRTSPVDDRAIRRRMTLGNPFVHSSVMYRRSVLDQAGLFNNRLWYAEDYDMIERCLRLGKGAILPAYLVAHRVHSRQAYRAGLDVTVRWRMASRIAVRAAWRHNQLGLPVAVALYGLAHCPVTKLFGERINFFHKNLLYRV